VKLFDYVNAISYSKERLPLDGYNSFMVNRALGNFQDCVLLANEMNHLSLLDNELKFDFFINTVRKKKRFSKWPKRTKDDDRIEEIKQKYGYSNEKAQQVLDLF
jgi:hypothetical protein